MSSYSYTIIFLFLTGLSFAQKPSYKERNPQIQVNDSDMSITAEFVRNPNKKIIPRSNQYYHWYLNNRIMVTQGGYDGKLLHGKYTSAYLHGNLKEQGKYRNGITDGKWSAWYSNGNLKNVYHYFRGAKQGPFKEYNEFGQPTSSGYYRNGQLHGWHTSYKDGKPEKTIYFYKGKETDRIPFFNKNRNLNSGSKPAPKSGEKKEKPVVTKSGDQTTEKKSFWERLGFKKKSSKTSPGPSKRGEKK